MPTADETTISVNGGPAVPLSTVKEALDIVRGSNGSVASDQLRLFIERIERLEEEKGGISDDIKDVYAEAKANGYDSKIMRIMVRLRKMETHTRQEQCALVETYAEALGLQGVLPL
jgi:uncharacterized protein (UPF0335 family)